MPCSWLRYTSRLNLSVRPTRRDARSHIQIGACLDIFCLRHSYTWCFLRSSSLAISEHPRNCGRNRTGRNYGAWPHKHRTCFHGTIPLWECQSTKRHLCGSMRTCTSTCDNWCTATLSRDATRGQTSIVPQCNAGTAQPLSARLCVFGFGRLWP